MPLCYVKGASSSVYLGNIQSVRRIRLWHHHFCKTCSEVFSSSSPEPTHLCFQSIPDGQTHVPIQKRINYPSPPIHHVVLGHLCLAFHGTFGISQYLWHLSVGKESACNAEETLVRFLGWEDPLEKGKATHSSILAWRIPRTVHGVAKSRTRLRLSLSLWHLIQRLFTWCVESH